MEELIDKINNIEVLDHMIQIERELIEERFEIVQEIYEQFQDCLL